MNTSEHLTSLEPREYNRTAAKTFYRQFNETAPSSLRLTSAGNAEIDAVLGFSIDHIETLDDIELQRRETGRLAVLLAFLDGAKVSEARSYAADIDYGEVGQKDEFMKSVVSDYVALMKNEFNIEAGGNFIEHHDLLRLLNDLSKSNRITPYQAQSMAGLLGLVKVDHVDPERLKMAYRTTGNQLQRIISERAPRVSSRRSPYSFVPGTEHLIYQGIEHLKKLVGYPQDDVRSVPISQIVAYEVRRFAKPGSSPDREAVQSAQKLVEDKIGFALEHLYGRVY